MVPVFSIHFPLTGNVREIVRLLGCASVPVGTVFCSDRLERVGHAAAYTVGTNMDFTSGVGLWLGGTLGFEEISTTFKRIASVYPEADMVRLTRKLNGKMKELSGYVISFSAGLIPLRGVIFGGYSYATFAAGTLKHYLDADILYIGARNEPGVSPYRVGMFRDFPKSPSLIQQCNPRSLSLGHRLNGPWDSRRAFVGLTPPLRGMVKLAPHSVAGIAGTLSFVERM